MRNILIRNQRVLNRTQSKSEVAGIRWLLCLSLLLFSSCGRTSIPVIGDAHSASGGVDTSDSIPDGEGPEVNVAPDVGSPDTNTAPDSGGHEGSGDATRDASYAGEPLPKVCTTKLPNPGEPCTKVGAIRCTNLGANDKLPSGFCRRPNHLLCVKQPNGELRWVLQDCAGRQPTDPNDPNYCGRVWSCVEDEGGDVCRPMVIASGVKASAPSDMQGLRGAVFRACYATAPAPVLTGLSTKTYCIKSNISICSTLAATGEVADKIKLAAGNCAKYLEYGKWFLPTKLCPPKVYVCPAKTCYTGMPGWPNCPGTYLSSCLQDPTQGGQARCRKGCDDHPDKDDP